MNWWLFHEDVSYIKTCAHNEKESFLCKHWLFKH